MALFCIPVSTLIASQIVIPWFIFNIPLGKIFFNQICAGALNDMQIRPIGDCQLATLQELDLPDKFSCVYVREHNCLELTEIIQESFTQFSCILPMKTWKMQKIVRIIPCVQLVWTNTPQERGNHKCFHACVHSLHASIVYIRMCIKLECIINRQ